MDRPAQTATAATDGRSRRFLLALAGAAAVLAALTVALGLATLGGGWLRASTLVMEDHAPPATAPTYADAPDAAAFFEARDTITVAVPWDMTVADFLAYYHLENNPDARRALREQLDAATESDRLTGGDMVSFYLTARRGTRER